MALVIDSIAASEDAWDIFDLEPGVGTPAPAQNPKNRNRKEVGSTILRYELKSSDSANQGGGVDVLEPLSDTLAHIMDHDLRID